jgi:hypothetical protein
MALEPGDREWQGMASETHAERRHYHRLLGGKHIHTLASWESREKWRRTVALSLLAWSCDCHKQEILPLFMSGYVVNGIPYTDSLQQDAV